MKRSITRWTVTLAAVGVIGLPVSGFARTQDPAPQQPQQQQPQPQPASPDRPQQPPAQPQPTQPQPAPPPTAATTPSADQATTPQEHLRQAQSAVNSIAATSLPAKNRAALGDLKKHLSNLEKLGASPSATSTEASKTEASKPGESKSNWGTEVAAIDKIISEMASGESSSTPSTPTPTGTSGTTGAASKPSSTMIDEATRAKLMDVRAHITAYAAGMAGTSIPKTEAAASTATPAPAHSEPSMTSTTPSSSAPSAASSAAAPSQNPASAPQSAPSQAPQSTPSQNPPTAQPTPNAAAQDPAAAAQPPAAAAQQADTETAHKHLVAARDALSQMTQLPAVAQLSGEARTQISQMISNFNELIGNPPDWHASYQKVAANLTTLLGPDNSDAEANAGAPTTATGATAAPGATATPGAVGTAGTTATIELDPTIRAKLVEFRKSLNEFEKAAGGKK